MMPIGKLDSPLSQPLTIIVLNGFRTGNRLNNSPMA
jgi:hypothetical protein